MDSEVLAVGLRVVAAGLLVCVFALIGELVKPKRFAGIFSAAPSVALASLVVVLVTEGSGNLRLELEGMILGAVAFVVHSLGRVAGILDAGGVQPTRITHVVGSESQARQRQQTKPITQSCTPETR